MKTSSLLIAAVIAALLCAGFGEPIYAQLGMATLGGTITDASGAVVPGAQVTLSNVARNEQRKTVTNSSGQYVFSALLPGDYQLSVTASGFEKKVIAGIALASGQGSTLNESLSVGSTSQKVVVTTAPALLETTTATVGAIMGQHEIKALPMIHGNFTSLIATLPGVAAIPGSDTYAPSGVLGDAINPAIYGQDQRANNYILDGVENTEPLFNQIAVFPPADAISQMKVESGADSGAVGWASGATINIVTKSGTNQFQGAVWDFFQNNGLDAKSFFDPKVLPLHYNQFGGMAGGPLVIPGVLSKARGWYLFGYYEGIRKPQKSNFGILVPTAAQLDGNLAGLPQAYDPYTTVLAPDGSVASRTPYTNNMIPAGEINQTAQALAKAWYPAANIPFNAVNDINYEAAVPQDFLSDQWSARVDHQFGSKDTFYGRYSDQRIDATGGGIPGVNGISHQRITNIAVGDTHVLTPSAIITPRFGLMRIGTYQNTLDSSNWAKQFGFLSAFPAFMGKYNVLPSLYLNNLDFYPIGKENATQNGPQYYWSATVDSQMTHARHTLGFGFGWIRTAYKTGHTGNYEEFDTPQTALGNGTGNSLASYLLGIPADASRQAGNTFGDFFSNEFSVYAQDTYRITPQFTVDVGLRWDYAQPLRDIYGMGTFDWTTGQYYWDQTNPITKQPANIRPGGVAPDYNGYQPRLGIAYSINPKTVVRSSFGIFDDTFSITAQSESSAWGNWPFAFPQTESSINPGKPTLFIQNPFPGPAVGSATPLGCNQCFNVDRNTTRTPYVEEWSLSVQRQLAHSWMTQVAYFGSHGVKQTGQIVDNTALQPGTTPLASRQRWPQFPPYILNYYNGFSSWYDGLSSELRKQMSKGLTLQLSYTWSHALDETDSLAVGNGLGAPIGTPTRFEVNAFKGPAGFDVRNIFAAAYTYDVPWQPGNRLVNGILARWAFSGILSADSGGPFWVFVSGDNENIGYAGRSNEFPNLTCDPEAHIQRSRNEWFNTSCYQMPAYGTAGNAGRHGLTMQRLVNWDSSLSKSWTLGADRSFEFRADGFNVPNGHTFDAPNALEGSPSFGKITCCNVRQHGRVIQIAGKVYF